MTIQTKTELLFFRKINEIKDKIKCEMNEENDKKYDAIIIEYIKRL